MVELSLIGKTLRVEVPGWRKLLTFVSRFDIPLDCILRAYTGPPGLPQFGWTDRRAGGTSIPGWFALGRFYMSQPRRIAFLHLGRSSRQVVVLDPGNFKYDLVMVEVDDAAQIVEQITERIGEAAGTMSRRIAS